MFSQDLLEDLGWSQEGSPDLRPELGIRSVAREIIADLLPFVGQLECSQVNK